MSQISATPILLSKCSETGNKVETWELEYPRFIHGEFMTHRLFSRNAASSRAIPINVIMKQVMTNPAMPIQWGMNQSGMQAGKVSKSTASCIWAWKKAAVGSVLAAKVLQKLGLHKQIVNRVMEPFMRMKVVVTATDWDNWYYLRNHPDAQPEIHELARVMLEKREDMVDDYLELQPGEWHLPYVHNGFIDDDLEGGQRIQTFFADEECTEELTLQGALKISSSCCAQVSYRKNDQSIEKANKIWDQLVGMTPVHASPFEHQGKVMINGGENYPIPSPGFWEDGVTHIDKDCKFWSGNLKGFIQHRQLIKNNVCTNYEK